jgi:hypothetical protein
MNKYIKNILFLLIILCLTSCKTSKHIYREPIKEEGAEYIFKKLKENELQFDELSMRCNASISFNNANNSFKGNIRIKKDSVIWASITPLFGIEVFRAVLTIDSVKILNKLNNTYFLGDYTLINNIFNAPFDYDMIQSILTGNDFSFYDNEHFKAGLDGHQYKLSTVGRRKLKKFIQTQSDIDRVIVQDIWLNSETFKILKQQWKEIKREHSKLTIYYSDFVNVESDMLFPTKLICDISSEISIKMDIQYDKIQVNKPFNYPFSIPSNYTSIIIQ